MPTQKVRFTLWMDPEILRAAKVRAADEGTSPSQIIAGAARTVLIDAKQTADERLLQAVERAIALVQRMDRRRNYDHQVLKEMVGLMVQSFFNHTPAIPDKEKKAALHSGKARFNRFLDALAANVRGGESILNDLPAPLDQPIPVASPPEDGSSTTIEGVAAVQTFKERPAVQITMPTVSGDPMLSANSRPEKFASVETRTQMKLFG